ncbi:phosphatase PAP2 family protein [Sulfuriflexus mobilis]|uniref:phosphatase PAP2 family protein n=1 Tax=Sulfuriflexus mobilis TaxID=1811807 RepID=UPI000F84B146|nr:phosphatase PAP2 family protein [Sulfuriflexus mobilis]
MKQKELILYLLVPVFVLLIAIAAQYSGFDLWLEHFFYNTETHSWPYKSLFFTRVVLHTWAKYLVVGFALLNLAAIVAALFVERLRPYLKYLVYIFIAAVSGPLLVGFLKDTTHIYVPWDLSIFGGDKPHVRLFDSVVRNAPVGHGFPGGHSSGGFAYLSLYFILLMQNKSYKYYGLLVPIALGGIFALDQEIRGAHFLSHDLLSFVICWSLALLWAILFFPGYFSGKLKKV